MTTDTWHKPRGHGNHLTAGEIAFIRTAYQNHVKASFVAHKLQCSTRIVHKYYGYFRDEGVPQKKLHSPKVRA